LIWLVTTITPDAFLVILDVAGQDPTQLMLDYSFSWAGDNQAEWFSISPKGLDQPLGVNGPACSGYCHYPRIHSCPSQIKNRIPATWMLPYPLSPGTSQSHPASP